MNQTPYLTLFKTINWLREHKPLAIGLHVIAIVISVGSVGYAVVQLTSAPWHIIIIIGITFIPLLLAIAMHNSDNRYKYFDMSKAFPEFMPIIEVINILNGIDDEVRFIKREIEKLSTNDDQHNLKEINDWVQKIDIMEYLKLLRENLTKDLIHSEPLDQSMAISKQKNQIKLYILSDPIVKQRLSALRAINETVNYLSEASVENIKGFTEPLQQAHTIIDSLNDEDTYISYCQKLNIRPIREMNTSQQIKDIDVFLNDVINQKESSSND